MNEYSNIEVLAPEQLSPAPGAELDTLVTLYLGLAIPEHRQALYGAPGVSDAGVDEFVSEVVSIAFPDGWTMLRAEGGWRDASTGRTIVEPSLVLQVAVSGRSKDGDVRFVAEAWKYHALQDAVMVTRQSLAAVDFV